MPHAIGLDIGGTSIKAALVSSQGKITKKVIQKTETSKGKTQVIQNIIKAITEVWSDRCLGIGIGCPGPFKDAQKGIIAQTPNLPLSNVNVREIIRNRFKKPVYLDNDASCYVLGEAMFGAARGSPIVAGLTLGTGVGGGIVVNKQIFHGRGNAGELGHLLQKEKDFEYYLSEKGVQRLCQGVANHSIELFNQANQGNGKAREAWQRYGRILGRLVTDLVHSLDPDCIVIGGGISKSWKHFSKAMRAEIKEKVMWKPGRIVKARHQESGILGAAQLVFSK